MCCWRCMQIPQRMSVCLSSFLTHSGFHSKVSILSQPLPFTRWLLLFCVFFLQPFAQRLLLYLLNLPNHPMVSTLCFLPRSVSSSLYHSLTGFFSSCVTGFTLSLIGFLPPYAFKLALMSSHRVSQCILSFSAHGLSVFDSLPQRISSFNSSFSDITLIFLLPPLLVPLLLLSYSVTPSVTAFVFSSVYLILSRLIVIPLADGRPLPSARFNHISYIPPLSSSVASSSSMASILSGLPPFLLLSFLSH